MKNNYIIQNLNYSKTRYENIKDYLFTTNLLNALKSKNIIVSKMFFSRKEKNHKIELALFYRTQKIKEYRLKERRTNIKNKFLKINKLINENNLTINITNLNLFLKEKEIIQIFDKFKGYTNKLFQKRTSLFCDTIKIISLISSNKTSIWSLVYLLSLIFKPLQKKKHGAFVTFVHEIFNYLISQKDSTITGAKMIIAGRLKGKPRASIAKFSLGKISLTKHASNIETAQTHIYTIYGCFGLKLWINYKN